MIRIACLVAALALAGCASFAQRIAWSRDGSRCVIAAADGLHLAERSGAMGAVLVPDVSSVSWLNGDEVLYVHDERCGDWPTIAAELGDDVATLERLSDAISASPSDLSESAASTLPDNILECLLMVMVRRHPEVIDAVSAKEGRPISDNDLPRLWTVVRRNIAAGDEHVVWRGVDKVGEVRASGDGSHIAIVTDGRDDRYDHRLLMVALDGGAPTLVDKRATRCVDWDRDGALVFMRATAAAGDRSTIRLGTVSRWRPGGVRDDLAGALVHEDGSVRCLADGRILFTSIDATLPATTVELPRSVSLFALDQDRSPSVIRLSPRTGLDLWPEAVVPSPDGTRIAIAGHDGRVAILRLATGALDIVQAMQSPDNYGSPTLVPSWVNDDVLCYAVPPAAKGGMSRVVLRTLANGTVTPFDQNWPPAATRGFP